MLQQIARLGEAGVFNSEDLRVLVAAFEKAWASVDASRAPFSEAEHRERARDILAKQIIQSAKAGERDVSALAAGALLQLSKTALGRAVEGAQRGRNAKST
jgi:hypothetical protein